MRCRLFGLGRRDICDPYRRKRQEHRWKAEMFSFSTVYLAAKTVNWFSKYRRKRIVLQKIVEDSCSANF